MLVVKLSTILATTTAGMWPVAQALQKARAMAVMLALASVVAIKKPNHAVLPVPQVVAAQAADLERARRLAAHQAAVPVAAIAADHPLAAVLEAVSERAHHQAADLERARPAAAHQAAVPVVAIAADHLPAAALAQARDHVAVQVVAIVADHLLAAAPVADQAAAIAADHLPAAALVVDHAAVPAADLKVVAVSKAAASKKAASKKLALKRPAAFKAVHDNL